jgi:hypothetical protein
MELMQASFDGGFPDIPLPNLGSGLFRIHVDATCLCLSISRCIDAASLPGSRGTLRAVTESQSSAHPPGCLVRPFRDCPGSCGTGYAVPPGTRRSASGGALRVLPQSRDGILRGSFVLACFASASPEALVLRTASLATSCFPALDVRKARPEGSSADGR